MNNGIFHPRGWLIRLFNWREGFHVEMFFLLGEPAKAFLVITRLNLKTEMLWTNWKIKSKSPWMKHGAFKVKTHFFKSSDHEKLFSQSLPSTAWKFFRYYYWLKIVFKTARKVCCHLKIYCHLFVDFKLDQCQVENTIFAKIINSNQMWG